MSDSKPLDMDDKACEELQHVFPVCRICLQQDDLVPISDEMLEGIMQHHFKDIFSKAMLSSNMPAFMCRNCVVSMEVCRGFWDIGQQAVAAVKRFQKHGGDWPEPETLIMNPDATFNVLLLEGEEDGVPTLQMVDAQREANGGSDLWMAIVGEAVEEDVEQYDRSPSPKRFHKSSSDGLE